MAKYRKKPVVIEAFQMTKERLLDNSEWPNWLHVAWSRRVNDPNSLYCSQDGCAAGEKCTPLFINTMEGAHRVSWNDWIIQGVQGELCPCKPDIFEATYDFVGA